MKCKLCGKEFEPKIPKQVYCSIECQLHARMCAYPVGEADPDKLRKDCFAYSKSRCIALKHYYCMFEECGFYKPRISDDDIPIDMIRCQYCGKPFKEKHKGKSKYCSPECAANGYYQKSLLKKYDKEAKQDAKKEALLEVQV